MKVFLKYISKNMLEKKGRLALLLFSIAMSTALLVASTGIVDIIFDSFTKPYEAALDSEVAFTSATDDPFIETAQFDTENLTDIICELSTTGVMNDNDKIRYITIHGRESYNGKMKEGDTAFISDDYEDGTVPCILSERVAKELKLSDGDTIKLFIAGQEVNAKISAIGVNEKLFYSDTTTSFSIVVPYSFMNKAMNADGKYNYISANLKSGKVKSFVSDFNDANTELNAYSLKAELETDMSINALLYAMLAIVVVVSAIIIHGAFKLIMTERLTVIGTFMSLGATKKKIEHIVLLEGLLYAIFGGIIGCVIGETLLYFIGRLISPLAKYGIYAPFSVNPVHIAAGMIFAAILCVVSAYTPVRSIRKYEAKDVILGRTEGKIKGRKIKFTVGVLLLIFSIAVNFTKNESANITSMIAMVTAFAAIILITPTIVKLVARLISRIFKNNTNTYLTMNNIRTSKLLRNNIVLIVVSLSAVLLISSFGESMTKVVTGAYEDLTYDYSIENIISTNGDTTTTEIIIDKLSNTPGIDKSTITPTGFDYIKVNGEDAFITFTDIIPYGYYFDGYSPLISQDGNDFEEFAAATDNAIYLTTKTAKAIKAKKGDIVTVEGNSRTANFRVAGTYDGKLYNNGTAALVSREQAKKMFNFTEATEIFFSLDGTRPAEEVEAEFKSFLASLGATYNTKDEDCKANNENNAMIVNIMSIFSYLALVIASIGVFNNIAISFHQRKREFAVMASVGMNKKRRKNMILTESMFSVVISIAITIPFLILLTGLFTGATYFLGMPMVTSLSWIILPKFSLAIAAIIFIASLSTMRKSKKLSVVQELKYE